jgi:uncharacterized membrane protein
MEQNQNNIQDNNNSSVNQIVSATTISSSPFPSPETLEHYKKIEPELVNRIFEYIETNNERR